MEDIFYYYLDKNSGILLVCGRFSYAIRKTLKMDDLKELKYILYYKRLNDKKIYSLSKEVLRCAKLGDRISINIINSAADKLFNMVDILIRRLNMYDNKYNLCLTGSIVDYGDYITNPLCDRIYSRYDNIEVFTHNNFITKD